MNPKKSFNDNSFKKEKNFSGLNEKIEKINFDRNYKKVSLKR
jgi:hypothetical protein